MQRKSMQQLVEECEGRIRDLRQQKNAAIEKREAAKAVLTTLDTFDQASPEFRDAAKHTERVTLLDARLQNEREKFIGLMKMIGATPKAEEDPYGDDPYGAPRAKSEPDQPGGWLAKALDVRREIVPGLPERLRQRRKALTTANYSPVEESQALVELVQPQSVVLASGVRTMRVDTTELRVPRLGANDEAGWIEELGRFPELSVALDRIDSRPPKVGAMLSFSHEMYEDVSPALMAGIEGQLTRSVGLALDRGLLVGDGLRGAPLGISRKPRLAAATRGDLTSLAAFREVLGVFLERGTKPVFVVNPTDFGRLLGLVEETGSLKPLLTGVDFSSPGFVLPQLGVPIWLSKAVEAGSAVAYAPSEVVVVIRRDAEILFDPTYGFQTGEVGMRASVRADVVISGPDAVQLIDLGDGDGSGSGSGSGG